MSDLNDRNVEQLSAYLDGALSERERATLEVHLQAEPALRAELDSLRQTVALVRGLPRLQAPRSFALTPEQAGLAEQTRRLPLYLSSAFSALSAVAAVALIALGGYLLLGAPARPAPAAVPVLLQA
ncbi:MAG: anti-sigma factor family protein, partial [Aggregatilineales bacterium]